MRGDLRVLLFGISIGVGITCFVGVAIFGPVNREDVGNPIEQWWDRHAAFLVQGLVWCMPYTWIHAIAPGFAERYEWFVWMFVQPGLLFLFYALAGELKRNLR